MIELLDAFLQVPAHRLVFPAIRLRKEFVFVHAVPLTEFAYEAGGHRTSPSFRNTAPLG